MQGRPPAPQYCSVSRLPAQGTAVDVDKRGNHTIRRCPTAAGEWLEQASVFRLARHSCTCRPGSPGLFLRSAGERRNRLSNPRSTYSPWGVSTGGLHRRHARRDQHFSYSFDTSIRDRNRRRERVVLCLLARPSSSCLRLRLYPLGPSRRNLGGARHGDVANRNHPGGQSGARSLSWVYYYLLLCRFLFRRA